MNGSYGFFDVARLVASSDMAKVYLARDRRTGARVALKVLEADAEARFEREARMLATMRHPNVVAYVAHGVTLEGEAWLATEWLDGEDLNTRLARGPLPIEDVIALARGVAGALAHLHALGLVHRDVKPGNIFLVGGDTGRATLLDFGIARGNGLPAMTARNVIMGTPQYMPPEQAIDARRADARADVFALGAVLFHCVVGRAPYLSEDLVRLFAEVTLARIPRLSTLDSFVPRELDDLVARATARDPADRHASAIAFLRDLARVPKPSYCDGDSVTRIRAAPVTEPIPDPPRTSPYRFA
jgi:serine/threonine protein kinase